MQNCGGGGGGIDGGSSDVRHSLSTTCSRLNVSPTSVTTSDVVCHSLAVHTSRWATLIQICLHCVITVIIFNLI